MNSTAFHGGNLTLLLSFHIERGEINLAASDKKDLLAHGLMSQTVGGSLQTAS